ncbi:putative aminoglycoside phosphotransferase [Burkholderiales bacterium JOSHI_001]|nr:putative aminoglycoside phosphotransferase [Burkholderiales bacterium JOSHI_001]
MNDDVLPPQPLMEQCLDGQAMAQRFATLLPECLHEGWRVQAVRTDKVRRSSSIHRNPVPMTLVYDVQLQHPVTQASVSRSFFAKMFRHGASADARDGATPTLHLPELDLLLWAWPHDPGLPQLGALLNPRAADDWWGRRAHSAQALRYEPEVRASLCYSTAAQDGPVHRLFAKTFFDARGQIIHRRFSHFWDQAQLKPLAPLVAQPMGYCDITHTVWQAEAPGQPLTQVLPLLDADALRLLPGRLVHALAAVHGAPRALLGTLVRDQPHWLREVQRRRNKIARVAPELAGRAADVARRIEAAADRLAPFAATVIHGDFHPDQVWLHGDRVVLFDFDEFVLGDPMEDLAEFVTKLGTSGRAGELGPLMLAAYAQQQGEHFDLSRLRWHLAVQSLLQAGRAFKFQRVDWRGEVRQHLQRAAALTDLESPSPIEVAA